MLNQDNILFLNKIMLYFVGYVSVIIGSKIVGKIVERYEVDDVESLPGAGMMIGVLERILIITLVYLKEFQAIALVVAAKSIIRFEGGGTSLGSRRKFAEYFLIGTFSSILVAIFTGVIISFLIDYLVLKY